MDASTNKTLVAKGHLFQLSVPKVMGILNVTPDSFYDGKRYERLEDAIRQAEKMVREGVDFIDVGGYSSRPGATDISPEEEARRVLPVVEKLIRLFPEVIISIDTFRSEVAQQALDAGAAMVNDISAGDMDPSMPRVVAAYQVPYVIMHMRGTPQTMNQLTTYSNLVNEIVDSLQAKVHQFTVLGIKDLIVDPGFGFAKSVDQNFDLLRNLERLHVLGKPVLVGLSRKSMIWRTLKISPEESLNGSSALHMIAVLKGASILRVHDVAEAKQCIELAGKLGEGFN